MLFVCAAEMTNCSGATDTDYPSFPSVLPQLSSLPYLGQSTHVPLPPELLQEFDSICSSILTILVVIHIIVGV